MRIFISADMEGATGVVNSAQTQHSAKEYEFGCRMQLHDVNAIVEGAIEAGVDEILINDAHGRMTNLDIAGLAPLTRGPRVRLLTGAPKAFSMVQGVESADAAFFAGYHAKAGTLSAILDHTVSGAAVYSVFLNGKEVGETGLNAAFCAHHKIPLALVTGDEAVCLEASELMGNSLVTACVKKAHGRMAADCLLPSESADVLRNAAIEAVKRVRSGQAPLMDIGNGSFELTISFHNSTQCDMASRIPGTERLDGRTVRVSGTDMETMLRWSVSLISLGSI